MAKKNVERFYTHIKQEGSEGATRGKIPVAMGRSMGAKDGDVIEWEVVNGDCVGGRVLSKSERREYERENARSTPKSSPKAKAKLKSKKPVVDREESGSKGKKSKKLKKPSKRRTEVEFEAPRSGKSKKLKKSKFKLKKR